MNRKVKEVQTKIMKGLLDLVVLQLLKSEPRHGYQIITDIRRTFGVYFGPSTIYPLLNTLEGKGYVKSQWDLQNERPRKVYHLTTEGESLLGCTEASFSHIYRKLANLGFNGIFVNSSLQKPFCRTVKNR